MPTPVFLAHTYKDQPLAVRLIKRIKELYPDNQVVCFGDGEALTDNLLALASDKVHLFSGERLKLMECGGAFVERYLRYFINKTNGDILMKLDPDTIVHRQFDWGGTEASDWFGTVSAQSFTSPYCRGGCWGMRRAAVKAILGSGLLCHEKYYKIPYGYQRYVKFLWSHEAESPEFISHEDFILADIAAQLGLALGDWQDIQIEFRRTPPANSDLRWSATHPHPVVNHG